MSTIYKVIEKVGFLSNKLPGGGVKGKMSDMVSEDDKLLKIPSFMKRGLVMEEKDLDGFKYHRIRSSKASDPKKRAVLFVHGGGGMARATRLHYDTVKRIALSTEAEIVMAHYPLAPKYNVRYALDWLGKIYSLLLNEYAPSDIVFIGDSAGANLILSLTDRLERKPGKLIVISPACGLQDGKNRDIRKAMESEDPLLTVAMNDTIAKNWCRGVPLDSPDISPEFIDYRDFPPILMFYGSHEVFYPHVKNLIPLMKEQGAEAYFVEKPMCHDWALCSFLPEGREAMKKMSSWIVEDPFLL